MKRIFDKAIKHLKIAFFAVLVVALSACGAEPGNLTEPPVAAGYDADYQYASETAYYDATAEDGYYPMIYIDEPYYEAGIAYYYENVGDSEYIYAYEYELVVYNNFASLLVQTTVTRVIDGDTVEIYTGERVRFVGVDAPEVGEAGADEATAFVRERVLNQMVWLEADGNDTDRFGRLRRYVWLELPSDPGDPTQILNYQLNALLLSNGLAEPLIIGEVRNADLFRAIAVPLVHTGSQVATTPVEAVSAEYSFIGNRNSEIFHSPDCRSLPAEHNRVHFISREAAIDAGHRPCGICRP
ncbi:MAG: thermonuclease family protein [Oscillospiraceae bacterium]|nr:thermonuclease family protein [Oscillospiraceae bacterium]